MNLKKIIFYLGLFFLIIPLAVYWYRTRDNPLPTTVTVNKVISKKRVLTERYVITHYKPAEVRVSYITKKSFSEGFDVGWGQKMWLVTVPATDILLQVKMAKSRDKLKYSLPQVMTVNQFNKLGDYLEFRVFAFSIAKRSGFNKIKLKLFLKKRT